MQSLIETLNRLLARAKENQAANKWESQTRFHDGYVLGLEHAISFAKQQIEHEDFLNTLDLLKQAALGKEVA